VEDARNVVLLGSIVLAGNCTGMVMGIGNQTYVGRLSFTMLQDRAQQMRARLQSSGGSGSGSKRSMSPLVRRDSGAANTDPPRSPSTASRGDSSGGSKSARSEKKGPVAGLRAAGDGAGGAAGKTAPGSPAAAAAAAATAGGSTPGTPKKGGPPPRIEEPPEVRNKKLFPVLNKISTLVVDSDTLFTSDAYAVAYAHIDNVTVPVTENGFERVGGSTSGKTLVLLMEGLSLILALTSPLANEPEPSRYTASATELIDAHPTETLRALGAFATSQGNPDAALALASWRCAYQAWADTEQFTSLIYLRKKKPEVLVLGAPERLLSTCNKQLLDGKEVPFDWKERMKTVLEMRDKNLSVYALISFSRLEESEAGLSPNSVLERRRMCFVGMVGLARNANPQTAPLLAKLKESDTKLVVLFPGSVDTVKTWAVQCKSPILFDCMRHSKEKPMEIENPLEVDPNNRSIVVNFTALSKDQLRPIFAYDRIFMPRMSSIQKEQLVQALKEQGETVAYYASSMSDSVATLAADVVISPSSAPPLVWGLANIIMPSRDVSHFLSLFDAIIKANSGAKCLIQ
jgi:hypothetical protein